MAVTTDTPFSPMTPTTATNMPSKQEGTTTQTPRKGKKVFQKPHAEQLQQGGEESKEADKTTIVPPFSLRGLSSGSNIGGHKRPASFRGMATNDLGTSFHGMFASELHVGEDEDEIDSDLAGEDFIPPVVEGLNSARSEFTVGPTGLHGDVTKVAVKPSTCLPFFRRYKHVKLDAERVQYYISKYGGACFAYCHLHNAHYHFEVPEVGIVSYAWVTSYLGKAAMVVTDPLVAKENIQTLLEQFHKRVPGMKHYTCVSQPFADALKTMGYTTTVMGTDYYADFQEWKLTKKSSLRRYQKQGKNEGLTYKEQAWKDVDQKRVVEISQGWLKTKKWGGAELQLMTWPFYTGDEWECRKFYAYNKEGTMIAYIFFLPCFRDNKVVGWCANILRRDADSKPNYVLDFLIMSCADQFRAEGYEFLALAPAMLHGMYDTDNQSSFARNVMKMTLQCPKQLHFYPFTTLGAHKDHFKVNRTQPVYGCAKGLRGNASMLFLSMTVTNILPVAKLFHGIHS